MNLSKSLIITGTLLNFMLRVSNAYTSEYCKTFNTINGEHINDYRMPLHDCLISFTLPFNCLECTDIVRTNNDHIESVQILYDNIKSAMIDSNEKILLGFYRKYDFR